MTYTTAAQLSSTLNWCDFHFSIDISDAYHLSLWAGCGGGELRPIKRPIITSRGPWQPSEVTWIDAMVNGCVPSTCRGGCDKDLSGIVTDGHVFRFAVLQFGQKTAGSPLGSIVRAVARFFARLTDPACCCMGGRPDRRHVDPCSTWPAGESSLAAAARRAGMTSRRHRRQVNRSRWPTSRC